MGEGEDPQSIETSQYPAGHAGHLTASQETQLDAFKTLCQTNGYYNPSTDAQPASHDDATLLRYLRARRFDPQHAFQQFKDTEDWRRANELDQFYETIDVKEYEQTRVLYPQWTGRRDRRGMPVYLFQIANLDSKTIAAYTQSTTAKTKKQKQKQDKDQDTANKIAANSNVPIKWLRLFALYENLTRFVTPLCTAVQTRPHPETPISQSNNIVDISNVGLWQFWNLKTHMQDASELATAHYPETLDRIFIIGAPSFFPTVWGWVKRWFDPVTVSKIFILSHQEVLPTLEKFIELDNIPTRYGGRLDFNWGDMPNLEPAIEQAVQWHEEFRRPDGHRTIPTGPIRWQRSGDGNGFAAVAVGSEDGKQRRIEVGTTSTVLSPVPPTAPAA